MFPRGIHGHDDMSFQVSNFSSQRPTQSSSVPQGTQVTSVQNSKGSWTQVISNSNLTRDCYMIELDSNQFSGSASSDLLVDVGIDASGGTSYTVLVPDIMVHCGTDWDLGGGVRLYFPMFVPSGSSVAVRTASNSAAQETGFGVTLYGAPRDRNHARAGTYAEAFGTNSGTSGGTSVTSGTTSEGSWTLLASSLSRPHWWWQLCLGTTNTLTSGDRYHADLAWGDGTNFHIILQDVPFTVCGVSFPAFASGGAPIAMHNVPSGVNLYGRIQTSGSVTGMKMSAIGIGG